MTPRNTKQGASANARRAPSKGEARDASSSRTRTPKLVAPPRAAKQSTAQTKQSTKSAPRAKKTPVRPEPSSWRWWLLPVVAIVVASVFVGMYYPVAKVQYRETREKVRLQGELDGIRARNSRLSQQVERLKTPEGIEDYARVRLGMVKAGEEVGIVVDGTEPTQAPTAVAAAPLIDSEETVAPPVGQWTEFLDAVFGTE